MPNCNEKIWQKEDTEMHRCYIIDNGYTQNVCHTHYVLINILRHKKHQNLSIIT